MPVRPCPDGKYRIGKGGCIYKDRKSAARAYIGYLATKKVKERCPPGGPQHDGRGRGAGYGTGRRGLLPNQNEAGTNKHKKP